MVVCYAPFVEEATQMGHIACAYCMCKFVRLKRSVKWLRFSFLQLISSLGSYRCVLLRGVLFKTNVCKGVLAKDWSENVTKNHLGSSISIDIWRQQSKVVDLLYLAYRLAAMNPHSPDSAFSGVSDLMLVAPKRAVKYSLRSVMLVLTTTLFSHSNSAHIWRNSVSEQ